MKIVVSLLTAALLLAPQLARADDALLTKAASVNAGLHSFKASMKAHVALTTFPFLATDIVADYYHKDPDLYKLDIVSGLPGVASQFSKLYPHIEPPSRWPLIFIVTRVNNDGTRTSYRLVPKKRGNVDHIDAVIDDTTATIASLRWNYDNGGWAVMTNTYAQMSGYTVIVAQSGHVDEPAYKGDITSTISDYTFNPPIPDSVFSQ